MWSAIKGFFQSAFSKAGRVSLAFLRAFLDYAEKNMDDVLEAAARAGYEAAEKSDKTGLGKLEYAASHALGVLGSEASKYALGAVYTACQIAWVEAQK